MMVLEMLSNDFLKKAHLLRGFFNHSVPEIKSPFR